MEQQASADVPGSALPPAEEMPPRWRTEEEELQLALNISMMEEPDMPLAGEALTSALAPAPSQGAGAQFGAEVAQATEASEEQAQIESTARASQIKAALPAPVVEADVPYSGGDVPCVLDAEPPSSSLATLPGTGAQKVTAVIPLGSIAPLHAEVDSRTSGFRNVGASCYINSMLQAAYGVAEVSHVQPWGPFVPPENNLFRSQGVNFESRPISLS
jgi:hypothetical protein